jgi:hypothetical protein
VAQQPAKHGRDHCPGGADPIPCFPGAWVRRRYTGSTLSFTSGNDLAVSFNTNGEQGSDDWRDFFEVTSAVLIEPKVKGHYMLSGKFRWANVFGNSIIILHDGPQFSEVMGGSLANIAGSESTTHAFTFAHRFEAGVAIQVNLVQNSGSAQILDAGYLELRYDGPYTGPNPDDANTIDPVE